MEELHIGILKIVNKIRSPNGARISELVNLLTDEIDPFHAIQNGRIPDHTGSAIFGRYIYKLALKNYIKVFDTNKNEDLTLQIIHLNDDNTYSVGYATSFLLCGNEEKIVVTLNDKFGEIQELFGLSVTSMLRERTTEGLINAVPVFGKPKGELAIKKWTKS